MAVWIGKAEFMEVIWRRVAREWRWRWGWGWSIIAKDFLVPATIALVIQEHLRDVSLKRMKHTTIMFYRSIISIYGSIKDRYIKMHVLKPIRLDVDIIHRNPWHVCTNVRSCACVLYISRCIHQDRDRFIYLFIDVVSSFSWYIYPLHDPCMRYLDNMWSMR